MAKASTFEKRLAALEKTITDFFMGSSSGAKKPAKRPSAKKAVKKTAAKKTAKKKTAKRKR